MPARVAVFYSPGSTGIRDLVRLAARRTYELYWIPGAGSREAALNQVLASLGPTVPTNASSAEIEAFLREGRVDGIVCFADVDLIRCAVIAERLGLPCISPLAARNARSKYRQRTLLNQAACSSQSVLRFRPPTLPPAAATVPYPAIVKPNRGAASQSTYRVDAYADAEALVARLDHRTVFVIESMIPGVDDDDRNWTGDYVSVESVVAADGIVVHYGTTTRFPLVKPFRERGAIVPTVLASESVRDVEAMASRAIRALGIRSAAVHTELKLTTTGPRVIEVNARLGGYMHDLYNRCGIGNLLDAAFDIALGRSPQPPELPTGFTAIWLALSPIGRSRVVSIPDSRELLSLPGVWKVERLRDPGDWVSSAEGTTGRVVEVSIEAASADQLRTHVGAVRAYIDEHLTFAAAEPIAS